MTAQNTSYSASQAASVANLLAVPVWARGVRNSDGLEFFSFSSSTRPGLIHHTRRDGQGCTCPGQNGGWSGMCCHRISVIERANEEALAIVPLSRNEAIYAELAAQEARREANARILDAMGDDGTEAAARVSAKNRAEWDRREAAIAAHDAANGEGD